METPLTDSQALLPGAHLEEFLIEKVLGAGGFGITYLARDTSLGRQVVIKENLPSMCAHRDTSSLVVRPSPSHEDEENFRWSLENFSKEATMLASLDHPGIVKVHRSFEAFGTAYFVMPFVEGLAFDELIRERRAAGQSFSEVELKGLLTRVLDALSHLHARGIYHRDIKPGNILITNEGIPVLIDFGSARQRLSEHSMTVIESPGYTPFEQLQSRGNVGPWSDLYALGGTLVKAIAGEAPPKATDRAFDDPFVQMMDLPELSAAFSPAFLSALDRSLANRPAERWQDAGEWKAALEETGRQRADLPASPLGVVSVPECENQSGPLPVEERDFPLTESTSIRMCWIPPGEFLMGSPEEEARRHYNEIQHSVTLTQGFWIAKYPVTQVQWETAMGRNPSHLKGADLPVDSVSWNDICGNDQRSGGFLGRINARAPDEMRFDLPTEAEWEYACRAGTTGPYAGVVDSMAWHDGNSGNKTHPVGGKKPNAWSLHDMHGNVREWCADWYGAYPSGAVTDPEGPVSGLVRVIRGGSCSFGADYCRAALRGGNDSTNSYYSTGFRLVRR